MTQCLNCGIKFLRHIRRILLNELTESMQSILHFWIPIEQIAVVESVCQRCYNILQSLSLLDDRTPPRQYGYTDVCLCCGASIRSARSMTVPEDSSEKILLLQWMPPHQRAFLQRVCYTCWIKANARVRRLGLRRQQIRRVMELPEEQLQDQIPQPPPLPPPLRVPRVQLRSCINSQLYRRTAATSVCCLFPHCNHRERLLVPLKIKEVLLTQHKLYVPRSARICQYHLHSHEWILLRENTNLNDFTGSQMDDMMTMLANISKKPIDFSNVNHLDPHLCLYWLGLTAQQFYELLSYVPDLPSIYLSSLLIKLRTGDSNDRLATLLGVSEFTIRKYIKTAITNMSARFVPLHVGFRHTNAIDIARRNSIIANGLFGNTELPVSERPAICICDGTYIYVQKSSNYAYQKQTYSLHKYRNLVKPFLFVACDGYILEVLGPYKATESDSSIMNSQFREGGSEANSFFRQGDVFILDRGFRDSMQLLQSKGFKPYMPESLLEGHFQLTTEQANISRCVTLCRWVVEVVNGRFKRDFRLLRMDFSNIASEKLMNYFKIAAALLNKFHPLIEDNQDARVFLNIALNKLQSQNILGSYLIENNMNRIRGVFERIDSENSNLNNFPFLSIDDLKTISLGIYQIKQARSYCAEHFKENGDYIVEVCNESETLENLPPSISGNNYLLRGRIRSRHIGRKTYFTYILVSYDVALRNTSEAIVAYYCNCLVGMRTVGCCAHVMSIIWQLGYARHQDSIDIPAQFLDNILVEIDDDEEDL